MPASEIPGMMKLPSKTIKPVEEQEDEDPYEKIEIKKVDYIFTKVKKLALWAMICQLV